MGQQRISDQPQSLGPLTTQGYESLAHKNTNGDHELSVLVSGVHCAACIQKIESTLAKEQDLKSARLNFSTHRLTMQWDSTAERANDYVHAVEALGYQVNPYDPATEEDQQKAEESFLLLCLGVAGFAMGNIMLLSVGIWMTTAETMGIATRDLLHWVSAIIALPTILFSGRPFFRSALSAIKAGHANMDVPISVALILTGAMSVFEVINHGEHVYFDSAIMLIFFLLIGRYLDFRARKQARSSATDLLSTFQGFATVIKNKKAKRVPIRDLTEGMIIRVNAGEKFPVDGIITQGNTTIDTSLITGETLPRDAQKGSNVYAGTLNITGSVIIKIEQTAEDSVLSEIITLMEKAGQAQAQYVRIADKAARLYIPVVHSLAIIAFLGWWLLGGLVFQDALMIAITVLIITCPCALGLAVPVVQVLASERLMKKGVLVKSGDALERLADIDTVLLDKTGTLTLGHPVLKSRHTQKNMQLAASLAAHSTHPLSQALQNAYNGTLLEIKNIKEHSGFGLEGEYNGKKIKLGARSWCGDKNAAHSDDLELWLNIEGTKPQVFHLADTLRTDAADTIKTFKDNGIKPIIVSGDRENIVASIAKQIGLETFYAETTPPEKFAILEKLKTQGHKVLMIGDGLNDAPVLASAYISMAPGNAIHMAQNAADMIFMGQNFAPTFSAYRISKMSNRLVKQNFALTILYNIIAVPLAFTGIVTPFIAALSMSGSSLLVIANSFRLKLSP